MVSPRKIGSPDTSLKKDIANKGKLLFSMVEGYMTGGVARTVKGLKSLFAKLDRVPLLQPLIGADRLSIQIIALTPLRQTIQQELILLVRPQYGHTPPLRQFGSCSGMIKMPMRQQQFYRGDLQRGHLLFEPFCIPTGVNQYGLLSSFTYHNGAVLLQRGYRDDFQLHAVAQ